MNWFMCYLSTPSHIYIPHEKSSWHWSCRSDDIIVQQIRDIRFSTLGTHCRFTNWLLQFRSWSGKKLQREEITVCKMLCLVACWLLNADKRDGVEPKLLSQLGNRLQAKMAHIPSKYGQVQVFYILWKLSCPRILNLRMSENVFFVSWASRNHSNFVLDAYIGPSHRLVVPMATSKQFMVDLDSTESLHNKHEYDAKEITRIDHYSMSKSPHN